MEKIPVIQLRIDGHFLKIKWLGLEEEHIIYGTLDNLAAGISKLISAFVEGREKSCLTKNVWNHVANVFRDNNFALQLITTKFFSKIPLEKTIQYNGGRDNHTVA
eukprot:snap_masked-scaffold_35-processed-gene-1.23-mRNA-1 protein AED:1.00 eAED:1.00 QI:0/-1/0/0/-1/1/1/0/104